MDFSSCRSLLDQFLDQVDEMDRAGRGLLRLTNGQNKTRDAFLMELGLFMLSVADQFDFINSDQAKLLDMVLDKGFAYATSGQIKGVLATVDFQEAEDNASINAFVMEDALIAANTGNRGTQSVDNMIGMYKLMGLNLILAAGYQNFMAQNRIDSYTAGLEEKARELRPQFDEMAGGAKAEEPAPPPAPKAAPAAKKPAAKNTAPKAKGGKAAYDGRISYVLPSGYQMDRETGDDGNEKVYIRYGQGTDDNGNTTWEFSAEAGTLEIQDAEDDKIPAGESPLKTVIRRNNASGAKCIMLDEELKAALLMREAPLNFLGRILKFYALMLVVEKDEHNVYTLNSIKNWDEEDPEANGINYQHMIDMIGAVRIGGKALPPFEKDAEELMEEMTPEFEGKTSIKGSVGLQIKNGDQVVSESVLVGDDDGTVHTRHTVESKEIEDGKYGDIEVKNGWVVKCLKKAVSVEIPGGVVGIEGDAFEKCTKLEEVMIPEGVTTIGNSAFDGCTKLKKAVIPSTLTSLGLWAFNGCKNLEEIALPEGLKEISSYAFNDCAKLAKVTVPSTVRKIWSNAFQNCSSLTEVTLPEGLEAISSGLFWGCEKLAKVNLPAGLTEIPDNLFNGCKSLKGVRIPDGVTKIGRWAFSECEKLESIDIPKGVDEIEAFAFRQCKKLKKVTIPPDVTLIDENLFDGCESLTEVILPEGLDEIKEYAFSECKKLKKIEIPAGVSVMERSIFDECESLESVTIPEAVTEIGDFMFNKCTNLKQVTFAGPVQSIGEYAFSECESLEEIDLPDSLVTIADGAFQGCTGLTSVVIPDGVESIGRFAFDDCDNLTEISMPGNDVEVGDWGLPDEDQAEITYRTAGEGKPARKAKPKAAVPKKPVRKTEDLDGKCEALGLKYWAGAVFDCADKEIVEVAIPDGVERISMGAFEDCTELKRVTIPDSVTVIEMNAFKGCTALEEIVIPDSVTELQGWVFEGCTSLRSVKLPAGITEIGMSLFNGCSGLETVEIPDGVTEIGDQAFNGCSSLTEITLPDAIEKVGDWAFDECGNLETVYVPDKEIETERSSFPRNAEVVKIPVGDRTAKAAAKKANSTERYTKVTPPDELYSHYGKLKREADKFAGMGVRYVQNNGEEFQAVNLISALEQGGKQSSGIYKKLTAFRKADSYTLDGTALKMAELFRVDQSAFAARHDDEGDINERLIDKKYKFSALRSFAWTLADMADREGKAVGDYEYEDLSGICRFIEKRAWLNYEGGSWFDGLCGHDDIHFHYMPEQLIASGEAEEICSLVTFAPMTSLEAFRRDLEQIMDPVIRLHNGLLEKRDRSVKLEGPEAAVVQAWCVMALAAKEPFFSEDGPMFFFHSYPEGKPNSLPIPLSGRKAAVTKAAPKAKKEEPSAAVQSAENYEIVKGTDGKDRIKIGEYPAGKPITWLVLKDDRDDLLLLSEYGLDAKAFNDISYAYEKTGSFGKSTSEWQDCSLRQWLNNEFMNQAFTEKERGMLKEDTHDTSRMNSKGQVEETGNVSDKVWLLSAQEANTWFTDQRAKICKATDFAKSQGAETEGGPMQCHWWLRTPAVELMPGLHMWAACVMASGGVKGWGVTASNVCVRPVIRVKKDRLSGGTAPAAEEKPAAKKPAVKKPAVKAEVTTADRIPAAEPEKKAGTAKPAAPAAKAPAKAAAKPAGTKKTASKAVPGEITLDLNGSKVITDHQFSGYKDAAKVIIPEGVTEIGAWAFSNSLVEEFVLPKSLKKIGNYAFYENKKLQSVEIPDGLETVERAAFQGCQSLKDLHIPDSIRQIDISAVALQNGGSKGPMIHLSGELARRIYKNREYRYSDGLSGRRFEIDGDYFDSLKKYMEYWEKNEATEAHFANKPGGAENTAPKPAAAKPAASILAGTRVLNVTGTSIPGNAYMADQDSRPMVIPEGVTRICASAFTLAHMESVKLPRSMRVLEHHSFSACSNLRKIELNEGLQQIDCMAISDCKLVTELTLPDSIRKLDVNALADGVGIPTPVHITLRLSGKLARYLVQNKQYDNLPAVYARGFIVDGKHYTSLEDYALLAAEAERKQQQRNALNTRIRALEKERDSLTGILSIFRKKKLQSDIDALNGLLRRL